MDKKKSQMHKKNAFEKKKVGWLFFYRLAIFLSVGYFFHHTRTYVVTAVNKYNSHNPSCLSLSPQRHGVAGVRWWPEGCEVNLLSCGAPWRVWVCMDAGEL